jgi:hypothetical protein
VAVVTCPKCPTSLRIPDGVAGNVKCPKCNSLFPVAASPAASSTTSAAPPAPPKPAPLPPPPPPKQVATSGSSTRTPALKTAVDDGGFDVVDEPKSKKRTVVDDDDDEPRKKKKRNDDDDDDEPRKKKKRNDDDDDDGEKSSRKKKKSRRDDDWTDDEMVLGSMKKEGHGKARTGLLLVTISSWLYFSLYALLTAGVFLVLVILLAGEMPGMARQAAPSNTFASRQSTSLVSDVLEGLLIVIGLIGLANWAISLAGFTFCIAGPERSRAISIITTCVCAVHLILVFVSYLVTSELLSGVGKLGQVESFSWLLFATTQPFLDTFIPILIYNSRAVSGEYIVVILTGVIEVVRLFFIFLVIRTLAAEGKNDKVYHRAQIGIVGTAIVIGAGILLMLLVIVLSVEIRFRNLKTAATLMVGSFFVVCLAYTILLMLPAITAMGARGSLSSRRR